VKFARLSERVKFALKRVGENLWIKPLLASLVSLVGIVAAKLADRTALADVVPVVTVESIQTLLSIMASSVLVIASLAVASMVSAYASASNTASPRAFPLVISDDLSQNALSAFVSTFIYSIVGLIASKNQYFGPGGRFVLFVLTLLVLTFVVLMFVAWIDRIARLGRISVTIEQVERVTTRSLRARRANPFLGGQPLRTATGHGLALHVDEVGFLQHIDMRGLQHAASQANLRFELVSLPGAFVTPDRAIAYCVSPAPHDDEHMRRLIRKHFVIGRDRTFEEDPRFGLIVLSQIAGRALSPAVNDPGTAIDVIGVLVRLLLDWNAHGDADNTETVRYDRISVPPLNEHDMLDDAFTAIERDGVGTIEVTVRLLRGIEALARLGDHSMRAAALRHAERTLALAEQESHLPADRAIIAERSAFL